MRKVELVGDELIYCAKPQPLGGVETVVCLVRKRQRT
jgi:hypothetical protein